MLPFTAKTYNGAIFCSTPGVTIYCIFLVWLFIAYSLVLPFTACSSCCHLLPKSLLMLFTAKITVVAIDCPIPVAAIYCPILVTAIYCQIPVAAIYCPIPVAAIYCPISVAAIYCPIPVAAIYCPIPVAAIYCPIPVAAIYCPISVAAIYCPNPSSCYFLLQMGTAVNISFSTNIKKYRNLSTDIFYSNPTSISPFSLFLCCCCGKQVITPRLAINVNGQHNHSSGVRSGRLLTLRADVKNRHTLFKGFLRNKNSRFLMNTNNGLINYVTEKGEHKFINILTTCFMRVLTFENIKRRLFVSDGDTDRLLSPPKDIVKQNGAASADICRADCYSRKWLITVM